MFCSASAFNQPLGSWDMRRVTNANGMLARADAFQQLVSGWSVREQLACPIDKLGDHCYRVAGVDLDWHLSQRGRPIDQWLCAHDMVVILRRSMRQTFLWRKLPEELLRVIGHWLGLNIVECLLPHM
jgi:hypothetical protein